MTATLGAGRPYSRPLMLLGHYSGALLAAAAALSLADDATGQAIGVLSWVSTAAWCTWIAAMFAGMRYHQEHLCERCIAATPLDPQAAVGRWRPALRFSHARRARIVLLGSVLAWVLVAAIIGPRHGWWGTYAADAAVCLAVCADYGSAWQHRRLYPWCPWCRWDGGGDAEISPDVPAPAVSR